MERQLSPFIHLTKWLATPVCNNFSHLATLIIETDFPHTNWAAFSNKETATHFRRIAKWLIYLAAPKQRVSVAVEHGNYPRRGKARSRLKFNPLIPHQDKKANLASDFPRWLQSVIRCSDTLQSMIRCSPVRPTYA